MRHKAEALQPYARIGSVIRRANPDASKRSPARHARCAHVQDRACTATRAPGYAGAGANT